MLFRKYSVLVVFFVMVSPIFAAELPLCPKALEARQDALSVPDGWIAVSDVGSHWFQRVTFKYKSDDGELGYDREVHKGGVTILHWDFPEPEGLEQVCEYVGTQATLRRPVHAKACDVASRKIEGIETTIWTSCDFLP